MAKKEIDDAAPAATAHSLTDDDLAYAREVIAKQHLLPHAEADVKLAALAPQAVAELVACGRAGQVAEVREILGLPG